MGRIAILCSGQGMQTPDMFECLRQYPECKSFFEKIMESDLLSPDIKDSLNKKEIPDEILFDNMHAQELICFYQLCLWEKIKSIVPEDRLFAGYSLGEPIAYACAGLFSPEDTFKLIHNRALLMSAPAKKEEFGMLAVKGLSEELMDGKCRENQCYIAIYNPGSHFICAGKLENIKTLEADCLSAGAEKVVELKINIPSHTPLLQGSSDEFRDFLEKTKFSPNPSIIMLEGVSGRRVFNRKQAVDALVGQISHPIMWARNISAMIEYKCSVFLELGPGRSLARMVSGKIHFGEARSLEEFGDLNEIPIWLEKLLKRSG
jgi:[acyl-carrier-protein] S-malonyltransferase